MISIRFSVPVILALVDNEELEVSRVAHYR